MNSILSQFSKIKIFVVGDVMLDHYIYGKVDHISPEAPVPVFNKLSEKKMLGGAGNVINNLSTLGVSSNIFCFIGNDKIGDEVEYLLNRISQDSIILKNDHYPTIEKTRIVANNQQLIRIDNEKNFSDVDSSFLNETIENLIKDSDIVILSDYQKGILTEERTQWIIKKCHEHNKKIIVDPKGKDYSKYQWSTIVKPNLKEFNEVCGSNCHPSQSNFQTVFLDNAKKLLQKYNIQSLLVTLSEYGMIFVESLDCHNVIQIPTDAKEVFDVSGAGDTSIAVFSASLATGADIYESMRLANIAAGIVVGKRGTSTVSIDEIKKKI